MSKRKAESHETTCNICLDTIKNKATLDGCTHTFCRKCIVKWSNTSNTCPCCRTEFTKVKTAKSTKTIKRARQTAEDDHSHIIGDFLVETTRRFISSDQFKMIIAERFLRHPDPAIHLICRHLRRYLNSRYLADWITSVDEEGTTEQLERAREQIDRARDAIEALYRTAPGSEENPISITT